jgi:hypothetical protein
MPHPSDNETWIIEAGDAVIRKKARSGIDSLSPWELLVYCLWVADYGMRNAGDLDIAADFYAAFQSDARRLAEELSLPITHSAFSLAKNDLEQQYFERFESVCNEIKQLDGRG